MAGGKRTRRAPDSLLGTAYDGLGGQALLEKLADDGRLDAIQAFWRYGDPNVCAALVDPILRTGAAPLVELIVDEILDPSIGEPLPGRLVQTLGDRRPSMRAQLASRLAERLRDPEPVANPQYETSRHVLEMWVLGQDGKLADDFAIDVIADRTPKGQVPEVRQAAYQRCSLSERALRETSSFIMAQLEDSPSPTKWETASDFLEVACQGVASAPTPIVPIVEKLLELAATNAQVEGFGPQLSRFAAGASRSVLERAIGEPLPDRPGARALLRSIAQIPHPGARARLFALGVRRQPQLWAALQPQFANWDESEWKRNLKALVGEEPIEPGILTQLLNGAPLTLTASVIELALSQADNLGEAPLQTAGERLRQRLDELGHDPEIGSAWVDAVHWLRPRETTAVVKLASALDSLEHDAHVRLVVLAFLEGKVSANTAAQLLPDGASYEALGPIEDEDCRAVLAQALAGARPDEASDAISRLQIESFSLEMAQAFAGSLPGPAFSGATAAFSRLRSGEKDLLVELLVGHATGDQIPVLDAVIRDDHRENTERRAKSARRIAELTPAGEPLPPCVVDLLRSNIPKLREAAVRAIQAVRPRDPTLIADLHGVVQGGGIPGTAATEALDVLAEEFLAEADRASTKERLHELIPLLGAVGRPQVFARLFKYLGASAEFDDLTLHRAAAEAVRQAAEHVGPVTEEDQTALVGLIDGEEREADPGAQADLSAALARIQLGQDAALQILYDELDFQVKGDPDELFGPEKDRLVRQLGLYARARDQGEAGWGVALAHLDNVAERLVRAAYLVCPGGSESIKQGIRSDPRRPGYGALIGALSSIKELKAVQDDCSKLRDIRSKSSEVPHPGKKPDQATMITADHCFKEIAKVCVGVLTQRAQRNGG